MLNTMVILSALGALKSNLVNESPELEPVKEGVPPEGVKPLLFSFVPDKERKWDAGYFFCGDTDRVPPYLLEGELDNFSIDEMLFESGVDRDLISRITFFHANNQILIEAVNEEAAKNIECCVNIGIARDGIMRNGREIMIDEGAYAKEKIRAVYNHRLFACEALVALGINEDTMGSVKVDYTNKKIDMKTKEGQDIHFSDEIFEYLKNFFLPEFKQHYLFQQLNCK